MNDEGYVKYTAKHTLAPAIKAPHWAELNGVRTRLYQLGLVGATPGGIGFGNVSIRLKNNAFLVSGTGTGALPVLAPNDYCLVSSFDLCRNLVVSKGPVKASSESMTHGAVYQSCPRVRCVIHVHSKSIYKGMIQERYPATPETAAYGTPEIALAVKDCARQLNKDEGSIVLSGHAEGLLSYGPSPERTFTLIMELFNRFL
jgi:ribulose-5-phosphate 4-epimerase/fuculose-1-phosphate aldolase